MKKTNDFIGNFTETDESGSSESSEPDVIQDRSESSVFRVVIHLNNLIQLLKPVLTVLTFFCLMFQFFSWLSINERISDHFSFNLESEDVETWDGTNFSTEEL